MLFLACSLAGIQASPPQKPEKKETPVPAQSSPLQGQSVLSFSPSRPATTSPKFSPSCVPGYSPPLSNPSTPSSAGGPFSPSVAFGKVCRPSHYCYLGTRKSTVTLEILNTVKCNKHVHDFTLSALCLHFSGVELQSLPWLLSLPQQHWTSRRLQLESSISHVPLSV